MTSASRFLRVLAVLAVAMLPLAAMACGDSPPTGSAGAQGAAGDAAVSGARHHLIYLSESDIAPILDVMMPQGGGPLERLNVYRQVPGETTRVSPRLRIARVTGTNLAPLSASAMAAKLRAAIDGTCTSTLPCTSHLTSIDDVGVAFRGAPGRRLLKAMGMLDQPTQWGSTYAKRIVMYVPIEMIDAIRTGKMRPAWTDAVKAVALGESYWLEMYRSIAVGEIGDVDYTSWTAGVRSTVSALRANGGEMSRMHFIMGPGWGEVAGMPDAVCPRHFGCQWKATRMNALNRRLASNGIGLYRFGGLEISTLCIHAFDIGGNDPEWKLIRAICHRWALTYKGPIG